MSDANPHDTAELDDLMEPTEEERAKAGLPREERPGA